MNFHKLLVLFLLYIHSGFIYAQHQANYKDNNHFKSGSVSGTLTFSDGRPISYAVVFIQSLKKHAMSNENGEYELSNIPFGKYNLEVKTIEANPKKVEVTINKKSTKLPLELTENSKFNLDEIVIVGKNESKQLKEKGFSVNVIETQKIAVQSIQTNELLDRTAGVRIRQDGGLGSHIKYNINGLSGDAIKIFIDGIPASNFGSSFSLSSIPPSLIERIDIYKGVVPGYLSEDALGGAINIILKQRRKNSLTTSYSIGSFNTLPVEYDR